MAIPPPPARLNTRSKRLWLLDRPDPVLEKAGLQPLVVGWVRREKGESSDTGKRRWPFFSMTFVAQGRLRVEGASHGRKWVEAGQIYLQFPNIWHRYAFEGPGPVEEYWIHFRGFIPDAYQREGLFDPRKPVVNPLNPGALKTHFSRCLSRRVDEPDTPHLLAADFFSILSQVVGGVQKMHQKEDDLGRLLDQLARQMKEHLGEPKLAFPQMAKGTGPWGYAHLRRRFKERFGLSPEKYFSALKITDAKARLLQGTEKIRQIAAQLGYHDAYHFSHRFTKTVGMSPRAFRVVGGQGS